MAFNPDYLALTAFTQDAAERLAAIGKEASQPEPRLERIRTDIRRTRALLEIVERRLDMHGSFDVGDRIIAMRDRPEMWGTTQEGFLIQLVLLLEFGGLAPEAARSFLRVASERAALGDVFTTAWGEVVAARALELSGSPSPPRAAQQPKPPGKAGRPPQKG